MRHQAFDGKPIDSSRWRHLKRGSTYAVIGKAEVQAATGPLTEAEMVVVYRSDFDGSLWVRRTAEFLDGRFEECEPATSAYLNKPPLTPVERENVALSRARLALQRIVRTSTDERSVDVALAVTDIKNIETAGKPPP